MSATTNLFSKCTPAIATSIGQCGSVTLCNAIVPTPTQLDSMFKSGSDFFLMRALFEYQFEIEFAQAQQSPLQKFFLANKVNMSKYLQRKSIGGNVMEQMPFIQVKRKAEILNNYWTGTGGVASGESNWRMDFVSQTGVPANVGWFNAGDRVHLSSVDANGIEIEADYSVVSSSVVSSAVRVIMAPQNSNSFLPSASVANPTGALAVRYPANVSDYENNCSTIPGLTSVNMDTFWMETVRQTTCADELYTKYRTAMLANNELYADFFDLAPAEYNKQSGNDFALRMANALMWSKPLVNQDITTLSSLVDINTVELASGARCVGKKANSVGFYEQHAQEGRVFDHAGQKLSIPALQKALYTMFRLRKAMGTKNPGIFDLFMPSSFLPKFQQAMLRFYKARGEGMLQLFVNVGGGKTEVAPMGFVYRDYPLDFPNITLRVMTDDYLDDYLDALTRAGNTIGDNRYRNIGHQIWIMDWTRNYMGVFATNKRTIKIGGTDALAIANSDKCVIESPTTEKTMMSTTYGAISEMPALDLILGNFSDEVPDETSDLGYSYDGSCSDT